MAKDRIPVAAGAVAAGGVVAATAKVVHDRVVERGERHERAYRLRQGEDLADGIRRVARGQIDLARDQLEGDGDVGEAVHEARKAFKRQRAVVRLVRDELSDEVYRGENATYRAAGRALSGVRDAAVIEQTLDELVERYRDELPRGAFARLRDALAAEAQRAHDRVEDDPAVVERVLAILERARVRVVGWPLPVGDDLAPMRPGFRRIYRRGRRALRAAEADTTTEHLHELRKRAKDLWHAAQVVEPADPKRLKKLARRAHKLSNAVGDDHDLAVLLDAARERRHTLAHGEREMLVALAGRRRAELQRKALERGRRLYARKPRKVAKLLT